MLTAAHCLPHLPPPHPASHTHERTFRAIVGLLDKRFKLVAAECLYVDPVADLAVLCAPDDQVLSEEAEAYKHLVEPRPALRVALVTRRSSAAWVLTLEKRWQRCTIAIDRRGRSLTLIGARLEGGMSGSPIVDTHGRVIGVVSLGGGREHHFQPVPVTNLPGWLLADLRPSPLATLPRRMVAVRTAWEVSLRRQWREAKARVRLKSDRD